MFRQLDMALISKGSRYKSGFITVMDAEMERIFAVLDANWPLHSSPLLSLYAF